MRHENGLVRQTRSPRGLAKGGLRIVIATVMCCVFAWASPSTAWAQDAAGSFPPELRPLDIVRPALPEDAAAEVTELQTKIAELQERGLTAETRDAQDAALDEAISLAERVLAIRIEHESDWTDSAGNAAEWHEVADARRAIADLRRLRGLDGEDRLALHEANTLNEEELALYQQGKYAEASELRERILAIHRRVLGDDHPDTLESINNMGFLLQAQGHLAEAEPYRREALAGFRRVLGDEHGLTLISINNMGTLLLSQGRLAEAEPYFREALDGYRRVLGDEHPDTLDSINNMGLLLQEQGKFTEAEPYFREALEGYRQVLGRENRATLYSLYGLVLSLIRQGEVRRADRRRGDAGAGSIHEASGGPLLGSKAVTTPFRGLAACVARV